MSFLKTSILLLSLPMVVHLQAQDQKLLTSYFYAFSTATPPTQLIINPTDLPFKHYTEQKINFGISTGEKWSYLLIKAPLTAVQGKYELSIDNTSIDTLLLFRVNIDGSKQLTYSGGNHLPYSTDRKYVWHTILLDTATTYYLAAFHDRGRNINVGYLIMPENVLSKLYTSFDRLIWFYLGAIFLIITVVACGWFVFGESALGYYIAYLLGVTAWLLSHYGYLFPMTYPGFPILNDIVKPLAILCSLLGFIQLLRALFKPILLRHKNIYLLLLWLVWLGRIMLLSMISYLALPKTTSIPSIFNISWYGYFSLAFAGILWVLFRLFYKSITVRLFSLALGLMAIMAILQTLSNTGLFYHKIISEHGVLLTSLIEITILTYGTFLNIWEDKKRISQHVKHLEAQHFRTVEQLVLVQDDERRRIAGELHDSIGPMLAAIKINFQRFTKPSNTIAQQQSLIEKTGEIIDSSMIEIRSISHQLMPKGLASKGLSASIAEYIENLKEVYDLPIHFHHNITAAIKADIQLNVYRIICELLLNATRHSDASVVWLTVTTPGGTLVASVNDNGKGFDPQQKRETSLGLNSIKSRVDYLKGSLQIASKPGSGSQATITIPDRDD